jgi:Protein of unknown function (DUF1236)
MTISQGNLRVTLIGTLLLLGASALVGISGPSTAQTPPSASLGAADPSAPLALTPTQRTAILNAVRQDSAKPGATMPPDLPVSIGVQLPASIALKILPDAALAQAPAAKTVQYTVIKNQVVLVDPTNMRVVDIISQ